MRHGGDEVGLDLFDHPVGGDVPEREDSAGDGTERIAHDRLAQ
jgi:hypothetical protein